MLRSTATTLWRRMAPAAQQAMPAMASVSFARSFSATSPSGVEEGADTAAEAAKHAPPLRLFGLPARYASALYTASSKAGNLAQVQEEFRTVLDAAKMDAKFRDFLFDPTGSTTKKIAGLSEFCDASNFTETTKSFLTVVAENGRLAQSEKIYECLEELTMATNNVVKALVTSAEPLSPEELVKMQTYVKDFVAEGATIVLECKVDKKLLAGFTVGIGQSQYMDLSLLARIRQVQRELEKPL